VTPCREHPSCDIPEHSGRARFCRQFVRTVAPGVDPDAFTPAGARFILGAVLRFSKPPMSFVCFLLVVVAVGAATGYPFDALGLAAFCFFVASIEAKPSWKFWYDPPAKGETGRASCAINSYQRVAATSPKEIRQLPAHRFGKTTRRSF
jgi:hypothetical protein